jgi:8-oxo-dGTP pyrophosphatase MutT (NUDIX family)
MGFNVLPYIQVIRNQWMRGQPAGCPELYLTSQEGVFAYMGDSATEIVRRILSENPKNTVIDDSLTPAAVTCLLYPKDGEYCILLNKRSQLVEHHKGEISFPGGMKDPSDKTLLETALREAHEEMGIDPRHVEILGEIDDVPTNSNFLIHTFVGTIPYPYDFEPSELEVARVLEVPIASLLDEKNGRDEIRIRGGKLLNSPAYAFEGHLIYGATARVLERFLELIESVPGKEALWKGRSHQL